MDFGFINSILKSQSLPPGDMWFSGQTINYYWFGHFTSAVATKLSNIPSDITYNLLLATILGLTLVSSFSISSTLINKLKKNISTRMSIAAGLISALLLVFGGNLHTPIYVYKNGPDKYWYPQATRLIGYQPETEDKTIHEFPIYSFVVSDLHAHLINLPYVLLFIALLLNYSHQKRKRFQLKNTIPLGLTMGIMFMTNTWDFANYLLVSGVTLVLFNIKKAGFNFKNLFKTALPILSFLIIGLIVASPFILSFVSPSQGIKLTHTRTPLWQLGVLWGFPAILTTTYLYTLYRFQDRVKRSDIFVLSLITAAWILIAIPEFIYLKDIYISSHYRANTMFKLTYQSFVMFYLLAGYIVVRIFSLINDGPLKKITLIFFALLFASILSYSTFAVNSYYGKLKSYRGLSGSEWLKSKYPGEYQAVKWFQENIEGQPTILEAPGDSYSEYNVISSYTGLPTVSGWYVHEWLWRGNSKYPQERVNDINKIYTSKNTQITKELLDKYDIKYVIIGVLEKEKYPDLYDDKFLSLGREVFSSRRTKIFQIN